MPMTMVATCASSLDSTIERAVIPPMERHHRTGRIPTLPFQHEVGLRHPRRLRRGRSCHPHPRRRAASTASVRLKQEPARSAPERVTPPSLARPRTRLYKAQRPPPWRAPGRAMPETRPQHRWAYGTRQCHPPARLSISSLSGGPQLPAGYIRRPLVPCAAQ